ncbi:MAG: hypothetical protein KC800_03550, partial [Candidatus Eremiobacteraeota bacterium]|nr:hypothetical protein [Candidatus Eremiobacteraeota bacterium]
DKDGWRGIKWMDARGLEKDARDGVFGNESSEVYLLIDEQANMADPSTLTQFLTAVALKQSFAERSFVDFWNHGGSYRGFGYDENQEELLSLDEMIMSFDQADLSKLDLIGFDACLMASVEVAQAFSGRGTLLVASEEAEPVHGWNYRHVVPAYLRTDGAINYARSLVDDYVNPASHPFESDGKTLSVLALDEFPALSDALDAYGAEYSSSLQATGARSAFARAAVSSQPFGVAAGGKRDSIDLEDFVAQSVLFGVPNQGSAGNLLEQVGRFVVYVQNDGTLETTNGVTIIPPDKTARGIAPSLLAGSGWRTLVSNVLALLGSDTAGPVFVELRPNAEGYEAEFEDQFLTRVDAVRGLILPNGDLLELFREESAPIPLTLFWQIDDWDGTTMHILNGGDALPLPLQFLQTKREDGEVFGIYGAQIELLESTDQGGEFDRGTLYLAIREDGTVDDYQVQTTLVDSEGNEVDGKVVEELGTGDRLKIYARTYDEGSQPEPEFALFDEILLTAEPQFRVQPVTIGPPGGLGVLAEDLACNVTLVTIDLLPPGTP